MPDYVPEEGVSRIQGHSSQQMSAKSVRRGLAVMFEYGFLTTAEGMRTYALTIQQLVLSARLLEQYDIACTLLTCHDAPSIWAEYYGILESGMDFKTRMANAINNFAIVHRERGVHRMSDTARADFAKLGNTPNMWIVPRQVFQWTKSVPEWSTSYMYAGPQGVERMLQGPSTTNVIDGLPAFDMPENDFARLRKNAQYGLMQDMTQIGEYVPMLYTDTDTIPPDDRYPDIRSILKYEEENDRFIKIDILTIVKNAISITLTKEQWRRYLNAEYVRDALVGDEEDDEIPFERFRHDLLIYYEGTDQPNVNEQLAMKRIRLQNAKLSAIVWNPWMTYLMYKALLLRGGKELGRTVHGHPNFMLAADAKVKTIYGHYTYWGKCIITGYKNVYNCRNIMYGNYLRGNGNKYFNNDDINLLQRRRYDFNDIDPAEEVMTKSMIITLVPFDTKSDELDSYLSLAETKANDTPNGGTYGSAAAYERVFNLRNVSQMNTLSNGQLSLPNKVNTVCCRGAYKVSTSTTEYGRVYLNTGHHGKNVIVGCANIRRGVMEELKPESFRTY